MYFSRPSPIGNVCGIPSDVLNEAMVNENKVEIDLIVSSLKRNRKKVKEFQWGKAGINFELGSNVVSNINVPFVDDCFHVLIFNQKESGELDDELSRSFLCKRIDDDGNLKVLNDMYFSILEENLSNQQRYINSLLHTSVCVLSDCICGTLFPYELVCWLATKIAYLKCSQWWMLVPHGY